MDRSGQVSVRITRHSVPVRLIGRQVWVLLHVFGVVVYDGRAEVSVSPVTPACVRARRGARRLVLLEARRGEPYQTVSPLPGLVVVLTLLAFADQLMLRAGRAGVLPWRNGVRQGQVAATGFEQLHASLSPGKQNELKERQSALVMPDGEDDGAPPNRTTVDLYGGTAVVRMPCRDR